MTTVIIAAHNEEAVIGRCLEALREGTPEPQIIVVANGCTDETASIARSFPGVTVLELDRGSKPLALNAGDNAATSFPRIYLDADIRIPAGGIQAVENALSKPGTLVAVPRRRVSTAGRPWVVRAYSSISERLPVYQNGLFGRGLIAVSRAGRSRFDRFPELIADDLFLDAQFLPVERTVAEQIEVVVEAPFTTHDLLNRMVRVRRGNTEMRAASAAAKVTGAVRPPDRWSWVRDVVAKDLRLLPAAVPYIVLTLVASVRARKTPTPDAAWGRDASTRRVEG